jgi:hypothetical protein
VAKHVLVTACCAVRCVGRHVNNKAYIWEFCRYIIRSPLASKLSVVPRSPWEFCRYYHSLAIMEAGEPMGILVLVSALVSACILASLAHAARRAVHPLGETLHTNTDTHRHTHTHTHKHTHTHTHTHVVEWSGLGFQTNPATIRCAVHVWIELLAMLPGAPGDPAAALRFRVLGLRVLWLS